jgi:hypothetical protein
LFVAAAEASQLLVAAILKLAAGLLNGVPTSL